MTEPDTHRCAACGHPAPVEIKQQIAFHVSFLAPAGICRDVIIADTPQQALEKAIHRAEDNVYPAENFDPVAESFCVRQITVENPDGDEQAVWTDPDYLTELHAGEILDELEGLIQAADDLSEAKDALDSRVSDVIVSGESAAMALESIRRKGGAQ